MGNVKSVKKKVVKVSTNNSSNNIPATTKTNPIRDIPENQRHQIISVKEFGDYNYDTRRAQWHKKAGHNKEQVVCQICGDDDNWATIQVNNGAHICYFCWVKKPTAETKKIIATAKKIDVDKLKKQAAKAKEREKNDLIIKKQFESDDYYDSDAEIIEVRKFKDDKGISYRNEDEIQSYRTNKNTIDKTSRYGASPAIFYDPSVDYDKPHDAICVVKSYDGYLTKAAEFIKDYANMKSREAIDRFHNDVLRAKLVTKKNISNAKIESLRLLTKAIVLEKNDNEIRNEKYRHDDAIEEIKLVREQRLEKNKANLYKSIIDIKREKERSIKGNEDNLIRSRIALETQAQIDNLKIEEQKNKVRTLASGQDYKKRSLRKEINEIKRTNSIPFNLVIDSGADEKTVGRLIRKIRDMDPTRLSEQERDVVVKFLRLVDSYNKDQQYTKLANEYKEAISEINNKISWTTRKENKRRSNEHEYMIVTYNNYKKVVNAKKETLCISMPINKLQVAIKTKTQDAKVKTKTIKISSPGNIAAPVKTTNSLVKIKPRRMEFDKIDLRHNEFSADVQRTIQKFKKLVEDSYNSNGLKVTPYGENAYKIDFVTTDYTKYQIKYKKSWKDWFRFWRNKKEEVNNGTRYITLDEFNNEGSNWFVSLFRRPTNDYGEPIPKNLNKLRELIAGLPSEPVIMKDNGLLEKERIDLIYAIRKAKDMEVSNNLSQESVDIAINELNRIYALYSKISQTDTRYYGNIKKAQIEDEKLLRQIENVERSLMNGYANAEYVFNQRTKNIAQTYFKNLENAQNQSLLNVEYIYEQEQNSLMKEDQQHLWNQATIYEDNNKFANDQYKYQNSLINSIEKEIIKFNKTAANPIPLSDLAAPIVKLPVTSSDPISLFLEKEGKNVVVRAESPNKRSSSYALAVNKDIPKNIDTIYVLDKYRNVKDLKTRIALLNEYAKTSYESVVKSNAVREDREINQAYERLTSELQEINKIFIDAEKVNFAANHLAHMVQERKWVQNHYNELKNEKWKIYDRDEYYRVKLEKLQQKQRAKELSLVQRERNKFEKQRERIQKKQCREIDYHDIIEQK